MNCSPLCCYGCCGGFVGVICLMVAFSVACCYSGPVDVEEETIMVYINYNDKVQTEEEYALWKQQEYGTVEPGASTA